MSKESLIYYREKSGYTQEQVAEILGVDRTTVTKWETSEKANPRLSMLPRLAKLYRCTIDDFFKPPKA